MSVHREMVKANKQEMIDEVLKRFSADPRRLVV